MFRLGHETRNYSQGGKKSWERSGGYLTDALRQESAELGVIQEAGPALRNPAGVLDGVNTGRDERVFGQGRNGRGPCLRFGNQYPALMGMRYQVWAGCGLSGKGP